MVILIGIEGATGNATKDPVWRGSFIDELCRNWHHPKLARYIPGPDPLIPSTINNAANLAALHVSHLYKSNNVKGIIFAAYSLGGAAAIVAAHKLAARNITIDFLALYDGVDPFAHAVRIPSNVVKGTHGLRTLTSFSRPYWPKCGRFGNVDEVPFKITHWGASGVLLKQGLNSQMPAGAKPGDLIWEEDLIAKSFKKPVRYQTACTWSGDLAAANSLGTMMKQRIDTAYIDCAVRFQDPKQLRP